MTVLSISRILALPRAQIWQVGADFNRAGQWVTGIEGMQFLRGQPAGIGGQWRFQIKSETGTQVVELEITEWLAGERFSLKPVRQTGRFHGIELFQLIVDLSEHSATATAVNIQCEYEPLSKLGRIKNLAFLRRQCVAFLYQAIDALNQLAAQEPLETS